MRFSKEPNPPLRSKSVPRSAPAPVSRWLPCSSPELSRDRHREIPVGRVRSRSEDQIDIASADAVDPQPDRAAPSGPVAGAQPPVAALLGVGLEDRAAALDVDAREVDRTREQLPQVDLAIEPFDGGHARLGTPRGVGQTQLGGVDPGDDPEIDLELTGDGQLAGHALGGGASHRVSPPAEVGEREIQREHNDRQNERTGDREEDLPSSGHCGIILLGTSAEHMEINGVAAGRQRPAHRGTA